MYYFNFLRSTVIFSPLNLENLSKVAIYEESKKESKSQYAREENASFWGPIDMSLCFSIYLVSAAILIFVYFKFIAKKNICFGFIYNTLFKHQQNRNGLPV